MDIGQINSRHERVNEMSFLCIHNKTDGVANLKCDVKIHFFSLKGPGIKTGSYGSYFQKLFRSVSVSISSFSGYVGWNGQISFYAFFFQHLFKEYLQVVQLVGLEYGT